MKNIKNITAGNWIQFIFNGNYETGKVIEVNGKTVTAEVRLVKDQPARIMKINISSIIKKKS